LAWIVLFTAAGAAGAGLLSWSRTPTYESSAEVLVHSAGSATAATQALDMATEKAIASSGAVIQLAADRLGVSPHSVASGMSASIQLNTHVMKISYASSDPVTAQRRAAALAAAYVEYSGSQQVPTVAPVGSPSPVALKPTIITPPGRPAAPAGPNHLLDLGVGIVVGLIFGVGVALLWDRLDDRIRGVSDVEARIGAPVLTQLPAVRQRRRDVKSPLVMLRTPRSVAAQGYRDLRTRVLRAAGHRGAKTLLVTSPANEDKSLVAANLAIAMAEAAQRIVLVCADPSSTCAQHLFGLCDDAASPAIAGVRGDARQLTRYTAVDGLRVLPASQLESEFAVGVHMPTFRSVMAQLRRQSDFVIVDAPAVLFGAGADAIAESVETLLVVVDARRSARRHLDAATRQLEHVPAEVIGCVLDGVGRRRRLPANRVRSRPPAPDAHIPIPLATAVAAVPDGRSPKERRARARSRHALKKDEPVLALEGDTND
jgi:capsular polysaccharide biosynthesis protein/cellulose biosynthesis protein BcsQ